MGAPWKMPDWMKPYVMDISENPGGDIVGLEGEMSAFNAPAAELLSTQVGRSVAVNAQVGLLVLLHSQGLLNVPAAVVDPTPADA